MVRVKRPLPKDEVDEPAAKTAKVQTARRKSTGIELPKRLTVTGNLLSCGQNEVGQLGLGEDVPEKTRPALVPNVSNVVDLKAGGMHSLYLTDDGKIYSFGCNDEGALGRDTSVEGSEHSPSPVDLPAPCVKISAGDSHSGCLLDDGRAFAWGSFRDSHGNMGLTLDGNKRFPIEIVPNVKFVDIDSGADHLVLLSTDGRVYTVGCAEQGQLGRVSARSSSGETRRGKTQLLVPEMVNLKRLKADAVWATTYCTFVRVQNGLAENILAFGLNNYWQLGLPKTDAPLFIPRPTTFTNVKSIVGGQHHTLVLTNDNKCFAIGRKEYGRLGIGKVDNDVDTLVPIEKLNSEKVIQLACGESCSFAVTDTGKVFAWGFGSNNQLGTGSDEDALEPTLLTGLQVKDKQVVAVSSGGQHTLFVVKAEPTKNGEPIKQNGGPKVAAADTTSKKKK